MVVKTSTAGGCDVPHRAHTDRRGGACALLFVGAALLAAFPTAGRAQCKEFGVFGETFYFTASSASGAVGDVVAVDISLTVTEFSSAIGGLMVAPCFDRRALELVGIDIEGLSAVGQGLLVTPIDSTNALRRPDHIDGAILYAGSMRREILEEAFGEAVPVPIGTLYFRVLGTPDEVYPVAFCDGVIIDNAGNCVVSHVYYNSFNGDSSVGVKSEENIDGRVTVLPGPALHPDLPAIPPPVKIYPQLPPRDDVSVEFELSANVASPGAKDVPVDFTISSSLEYSGYTAGIDYPEEAMTLTRVEFHRREGFVLEREPGRTDVALHDGYRRYAVEGERVRVATLFFDIAETAPPDGTLEVGFTDVGRSELTIMIRTAVGSMHDRSVTTKVASVQLAAGNMRIEGNPTRLGDFNLDFDVDLADVIGMLQYLFAVKPPAPCFGAEDVNSDGDFNIADPLALLNLLFAGQGVVADDPVFCSGVPSA